MLKNGQKLLPKIRKKNFLIQISSLLPETSAMFMKGNNYSD